MKRLVAILIVLTLGLAAAGCDSHSEDHKGHNHKAGEKH